MQSKSNNPAFNRIWHDRDKGHRRKNYVPLSERDDWDGKIEVIPTGQPGKKSPESLGRGLTQGKSPHYQERC